MHVVASRRVVLQRVSERAQITGRHVPLAELEDSLERVPRSVNALAPLADFLAVVDNSEASGVPRLTAYCDLDVCMSCGAEEWQQLSNRLSASPPDAHAVEECAVDASGDAWDRVASNFDASRAGADGSSFLFRSRG